MITPLRYLLVAACLSFGAFAFADDPKPALSADEATRLAKEWLAHVDAGEYAQSWKESAARFKANVTEEKWVGAMNQVRQPLGTASERTLLEAAFTHDAPRAPKGDYWIVKFSTRFEAIAAHELITLTSESDGSWKVVGFFIRPAS